MDILHDLFCYAALFISLKYIENIMSKSPSPKLKNEITDKCTENQHENGKPIRDKNSCEDVNISSTSKINTFIDKPSIKIPKISEENISTKIEDKNCSESFDLNLKTSSTTTTSDIIPLYKYSLKPASSTYMLNDYSTNYTSSLGNIPDSVLLRRGPDPPANLTDDYITDQTSEFGMSSVKSSNVKYSKSSMEVHVSSATTLLLNKTDVSLNALSNSSDFLQYQINLAAENIKKKLHEIETSTYKRTNISEPVNREKTNLPSTSKMLPSLVNNLPPIKSISQASEISSGSITPHETKFKGVTHLHLMEMLTQVTMPSYHSHQELNDSMEVAMIDEHVKMNRSIHDSSMYSDYTNSDQFSNITGHAMEHLGEDELYGKEPIMINHKNLMEKQKRFERSPNGSMIAVLDFEVHEWNEPHDTISAGTSKD